jgi:hypothetical protein
MIRKKRAETASEHGKSETEIVKISTINREENVQVTCATYSRYILFKQANAIIFPLTVLFFIASEVLNTFYMRFLAEYDNQKKGTFTSLGDFKTYWLVLGIMQIVYFILLSIKYTLLSVVILGSN